MNPPSSRAFLLAVAALSLACSSRTTTSPSPSQNASPLAIATEIVSIDERLASRFAPHAEVHWTASTGGYEASLVDPKLPLHATLPASANDAWRFRVGLDETTWTLEGANGSRFETDAGRVSYRDVFASTDAVAAVDSGAVEWMYVLRDANAPTTFSWKTTTSGGLTRVRAARDGGLELVDDRGVAHLSVPRPYAIDANGVRREAELGVDDAGKVTMHVDTQGLAYPVVVDPGVALNQWRRVPIPAGTVTASIADAGGGTLLMIDPEGTWLFDGAKWSIVSTTMSTTSGLLQLLNVGGKVYALAGSMDIWSWTGTTWSKLSSGALPPIRQYPAVTVVGNDILLFGGAQYQSATNSYLFLADTWIWNGTSWGQHTGAAPPARAFAGFGAVGTNGYLFGGEATFGASTGISDLWVWNGVWSQRTPTPVNTPTLPLANSTANLAGRIAYLQYATLYSFDGTSWTMQSMPSVPPDHGGSVVASFGPGIAYYGGSGLAEAGGKTFSDLWTTTDFSTWSELSVGSPSPRGAMTLAGAGSWTVLYGGTFSSTPNAETWLFDGSTWKSLAAGPAARSGAASAALGAEVVMFGGSNATTSNAETWLFDGTKWTSSPATGPAAVAGASMGAYGGGVVLYGDCATSGCAGNTWTFDGAKWTNVPTASRPSDTTAASLFTVGTRLFASLASNNELEFTGTAWTAATPAATTWAGIGSLPSTLSRAIALDGFATTWSFDGSTWTQPTVGGTASAGTLASNGSAVLDFDGKGRTYLFTETFDTGTACKASSDCTSGNCVDGFCCNTACTGTCQACTAAKTGGTNGTCAPVTTNTDPDNECKDAGSPACTTTGVCDGAGACQLYSPSTACIPKACTTGADCASGFCADGICCDKACTGNCEACTKALKGFGVDGVCENATLGTDPRDKCAVGAGFPNSCATDGNCNGSGACNAVAPDGTGCGATSCSGETQSGPHCNAGVCLTGAPVDCAPFLCGSDGKTCATTCLSDTDCAATAYCTTTGVCAILQRDGASCTKSNECKNAHCVDGVCCESACTGQCEACDEPGNPGSCNPVTGAPRGTVRAACTGDPKGCGGTCDGTVASACTYPPTTKSCGGTCLAGVATPKSCDGAGACVAGNAAACGAYACGPAACLTACTTNDDCAQGYSCASGLCSPSGAKCSTTDNSSIAANGTVTPCLNFACSPATGECPQTCSSDTECSPGNQCDSSRSCVPAAGGGSGSGGGCTYTVEDGGSSAAAVGTLAVAISAFLARRRRRAA